jgi:hypothetical protein
MVGFDPVTGRAVFISPAGVPYAGSVAPAPAPAPAPPLLSSQTPAETAKAFASGGGVCPSTLFGQLQYKEFKQGKFQGRDSWCMSDRVRAGYYWWVMLASTWSDKESDNKALYLIPPGSGPDPSINGIAASDPFFLGGGNAAPPATGVRIDTPFVTQTPVAGTNTRVNMQGSFIVPSGWAVLSMVEPDAALAGLANTRFLRLAFLELPIGQEPPTI